MLSKEAAMCRESGLNFDTDELVVVVCAAIRRVIGPFQLVMDLLLSGNNLLSMASARRMCTSDALLPGSLSGPNAIYT
ncbi:MAG: hypothetical protein ACKPKO_24995, partial [Candidatus Fonsibacter sp.]